MYLVGSLIDLDGEDEQRTKDLQERAIALLTPEELEAVLKLRDKTLQEKRPGAEPSDLEEGWAW